MKQAKDNINIDPAMYNFSINLGTTMHIFFILLFLTGIVTSTFSSTKLLKVSQPTKSLTIETNSDNCCDL